MDVSGSIVPQDEKKVEESAEEKSASPAAIEISMVIKPIEPQGGTDIDKSMGVEDLEQEAGVDREKSKERQVAENLGDGEAMQVDNDQMQGGSHSLVTESTGDKR